MQTTPRCFTCQSPVEHDPIYEAPCGDVRHSSAVFHPLCLMKWRETREAMVERLRATGEWAEVHDHD